MALALLQGVAILCALSAPVGQSVRVYLQAQLIYWVAVETGMLTLGPRSPIYAAIYVAMTSLVILAMLNLMLDHLWSYKGLLPAAILGFIVTAFAWWGMKVPLHGRPSEA